MHPPSRPPAGALVRDPGLDRGCRTPVELELVPASLASSLAITGVSLQQTIGGGEVRSYAAPRTSASPAPPTRARRWTYPIRTGRPPARMSSVRFAMPGRGGPARHPANQRAMDRHRCARPATAGRSTRSLTAGDADIQRPAILGARGRSGSGPRPGVPRPGGRRAPGASRTVPGPGWRPAQGRSPQARQGPSSGGSPPSTPRGWQGSCLAFAQGLGKTVPDIKPEDTITGAHAIAIGHEILGDIFPAMRD